MLTVYATYLSRYQPGAGWYPEYVRLDKLSRAGIVDTLVQSAGFPGVFPAPGYFGRHVVDGGWTDNIPVAPLLFDQALDLIFVIKVDKTVHRPSRWKRLVAAAGAKLWGNDLRARPVRAITREKPYQMGACRGGKRVPGRAIPRAPLPRLRRNPLRPPGPEGLSQANRRGPRYHWDFPSQIVTLVPPRSLGSVLTGTL